MDNLPNQRNRNVILLVSDQAFSVWFKLWR